MSDGSADRICDLRFAICDWIAGERLPRGQKLVITDPGSGYNTPPHVTIANMDNVRLQAKLAFDKNFKKNGGVESVALASGDNAK